MFYPYYYCHIQPQYPWIKNMFSTPISAVPLPGGSELPFISKIYPSSIEPYISSKDNKKINNIRKLIPML